MGSLLRNHPDERPTSLKRLFECKSRHKCMRNHPDERTTSLKRLFECKCKHKCMRNHPDERTTSLKRLFECKSKHKCMRNHPDEKPPLFKGCILTQRGWPHERVSTVYHSKFPLNKIDCLQYGFIFYLKDNYYKF